MLVKSPPSSKIILRGFPSLNAYRVCSMHQSNSSSFYVKSFGTSEYTDQDLTELAQDIFPLKPAGIINHLQLKHPRYRQTAAYGHFGRENKSFTWEQTDMVEALQTKAKQRN